MKGKGKGKRKEPFRKELGKKINFWNIKMYNIKIKYFY